MNESRIRMEESARQRHLGFPVGRRRSDRQIISLSEALSNIDQLLPISGQTAEERIEVVQARWQAGEWSDVLHGTEGLIDLPRALAELESQSELGKYLLVRTERSIEMSIEATREENS